MDEILENLVDVPCGLSELTPLEPGQPSQGVVIMVDGQAYDLGAEFATLSDERGLSIYADSDGDGQVDHVTTMLYDGSWETWDAHALSESGLIEAPYCDKGHSQDFGGGNAGSVGGVEGQKADISSDYGSPKDWGAYEWETHSRGRWG